MASELARELWSLRAAPSVHELATRYRRLCKLYHPDLQQADVRAQYERHMQQINAAYTEALKRFNIYTYSSPKTAARPTIHVELLRDPPRTTAPKTARTSTQAKPTPAVPEAADVSGQRLLASALATLQRTRTFFSLHGTDDPQERVLYFKALQELSAVLMRCAGTPEAQDALYYMAIAHCNLKHYAEAMKTFESYRQLYPRDNSRSGLFHFYAGLCQHRQGNFAEAIREYGSFLLYHGDGQYKHFAALVASYMEAARLSSVPQALPYG